MIDDRERRLLDRLPAEARDRLLKMIHECDTLMAGVRAANERRNELRAEMARQQDYIDRRAKTERAADDDSGIRAAAEAIKFAAAEIGDLDRANADRHARLHPLSSITRRAIDAIAAVPASKVLQSAKHERATVRGSHADAVEKLRSRIRVMKGARAEIARAPMPVAMLKDAAREQIAALAERGRPDLTGLIADGHSIDWPRSTQTQGVTPEEAMLAIFAFVHRDAMVSAVHRQIEQEASDDGAMAPADRDAALAKLDADIEAAERSEVALIDDAAEHGVQIDFRDDADVFAVLKISREFGTATAKKPAPYVSQAGRTPRPAAPLHMSSAPEPALRDPVI